MAARSEDRLRDPAEGERRMAIAVIGLDLAKNVFQAHGVDAEGGTVLRRRLRRSEVLSFFAGLPRVLVGWRPATPLTTGGASWRSSATRCG
jgi:hypothetical protein